jgi:hypothetical protein
MSKLYTIVLLFFSTLIHAQISDSSNQAKNQQQLNALIKKVAVVSDDYKGEDPLIKINNDLLLQLADRDSLLLALSSRLPEGFIKDTSTFYSFVEVQNTYIIVSAYATRESAELNQKKHNFTSFDILESKTGEWFYIGRQLTKTDNPIKIRNEIILSTGILNAWILYL